MPRAPKPKEEAKARPRTLDDVTEELGETSRAHYSGPVLGTL